MNMKFSVLSSQFTAFGAEALHPINAAALVLNGSMLICLALVIIFGRRKLKARKRTQKGVVMLLTTPRQCLLGLRRIAAAPHGYHLAPLTKEDRL
jgi:hypothetical protein